MIHLNLLDILGWLGFGGLMAFYWMIGKGRPAKAYLASTFGASMFLIVGIAILLGYQAKLPSLVVMETTIIGLNLRSLWHLRRDA